MTINQEEKIKEDVVGAMAEQLTVILQAVVVLITFSFIYQLKKNPYFFDNLKFKSYLFLEELTDHATHL